MYLMGTRAVLEIINQDSFSEDPESGHFLNYTLQRFTCELCYKFGSFLASLRIGLSEHCLSEHGIKNGGANGDDKSE